MSRSRRVTCGTGLDLEAAQRDGLITTVDADEVRTFGAFLAAMHNLEAELLVEPRDRAATELALLEVLAEHYPDDPAVVEARRLGILPEVEDG